MKDSIHRIYGIVASLIAGGAVIWGFAIIGSPGQERLRKFDEQRVSDLQTINSTILDIVRDWKGYPSERPIALVRALPTTLEEVQRLSQYTRPDIVDPQTAVPYDYTVTGETTYQLCATFSETRDLSYDVFWNHSVGKHCYSFNALEQQGYALPNEKPVSPMTVPVR